MVDWQTRWAFEQDTAKSHLTCPDHPLIVGVDEVGRGCLAGPVVACAVHFDIHRIPKEWRNKLDDSKKIHPNQRLLLARLIRQYAKFAIGYASVAEIDQINIREASLWAMQRAVAKLNLGDSVFALVDGNALPRWDIASGYVIKGDQLCPSISAASIHAKVVRDRLMKFAHQHYPEYHWITNAGYGTKAHLQAIKHFGITPYHRQSFKMPR